MTDVATGREIARVKTGMLWFDYAAHKISAMPAAFAPVLEALRPAA
jgi:hypothetical protein